MVSTPLNHPHLLQLTLLLIPVNFNSSEHRHHPRKSQCRAKADAPLEHQVVDTTNSVARIITRSLVTLMYGLI
jgi:hypothetical protein